MEQRMLGTSGIKVPVVTFGAWAIGGWMWGGTDALRSIEAIRASVSNGITAIDTAAVYGFGLSEQLIGEAVSGMRHKVQIFTKCGLRWDSADGTFYFETTDNNGKKIRLYKYAARESVMYECELSLKRLKTDYIDLYQVHWPDTKTPVEETMEAFERLKEKGMIRAAGVSNFPADLTARAADCAVIASNQAPYSMLRREIENDLIPLCINRNIAILAYSPLQRGILTRKFTPGHTFAEGDSRSVSHFYKPENVEKINAFLDKIIPIAAQKNITLSQLVLAWTFHQPGITTAIAGARDARQAIENAAAANVSLDETVIKMISTALDELRLAE